MLKHHFIQSVATQITQEQRLSLQKSVLAGHIKLEKNAQGAFVQGTTNDIFCKDFYLQLNSKPRRSLECLQLLNLIYIAFAIPMHISFDVKIEGLALMLESLSLVISLIVIVLNFRTPVIVKGETTLSLGKVAKYYW